jgi:hypothetical protein
MRRAAVEALARMSMGKASVLLACAFLVTAPTMATAEETIATAMGAPGDGAPPAPEDGPMRLSDRTDQGPGFLRPMGPCGGAALTADGKPDRAPHGEVWAGVGTNGYREVGGAVCAPLGDNAAVSLSVDTGHIDGWGHHR